jgi:purine-binding chemotaxis protein CheW
MEIENIGYQPVHEDEIQLIQFKLGDELYGVKVEQVREIVKLGEITSVPKMPYFIEGVMNLRGQITTIIDLRRRFEISEDGGHTAQSRIIVAEIGDSQIGIIVDSVQDVIRVSPQTISLPPDVLSGKVDSKFITGICRLQDKLVVLLDLGSLLNEDELVGLDKMERKGFVKKSDPEEVQVELDQEYSEDELE